MTIFDPDEFLYTGNQVYIAEMYERFLDDPGSVDTRWQEFFNGLADDAGDLLKNEATASWAPSDANIVGHGDLAPLADAMDREGAAAEAASEPPDAVDALEVMPGAKLPEDSAVLARERAQDAVARAG